MSADCLASATDTVLLTGLGNPGPKYEGTRHNVGFDVLDLWAGRHGLTQFKNGFQSLWLRERWGGRPLIIAKPQTFMNLSGQAVAAIMDYYQVDPGCLVVVHDDLDLPLGRLKIAVKGGSAGHKGVASVAKLIGTDRFTRLKVGIGRPRYGETVEGYVLAGFYPDQREQVNSMLRAAADCLEVILTEGSQAAMQRFHRPQQEEEKG